MKNKIITALIVILCIVTAVAVFIAVKATKKANEKENVTFNEKLVIPESPKRVCPETVSLDEMRAVLSSENSDPWKYYQVCKAVEENKFDLCEGIKSKENYESCVTAVYMFNSYKDTVLNKACGEKTCDGKMLGFIGATNADCQAMCDKMASKDSSQCATIGNSELKKQCYMVIGNENGQYCDSFSGDEKVRCTDTRNFIEAIRNNDQEKAALITDKEIIKNQFGKYFSGKNCEEYFTKKMRDDYCDRTSNAI